MLELHDTIAQLIINHIREENTDSEQAQLQSWLNSDPENERWFNEFIQPDNLKEQLLRRESIDMESVWIRVNEMIDAEEVNTVKPINWKKVIVMGLSIAVALTGIVIGLRWWLISGKKSGRAQMATTAVSNDSTAASPKVLPGHSKATLTFADGVTVNLDSKIKGTVRELNKLRVVNEDSIVRFVQDPKVKGPGLADNTNNTLTTPRGGQYQLLLPDGSKVWLNAASSISYPVTFAKSNRRVEVTGEVYFEVTGNAHWPFTVVANGSEIEVKGTKFNVNAYQEQGGVLTSLVQGKVSITSRGKKVMLSPGQEAMVQANGEIVVNESEDIENAIAWKQGSFAFYNADIVTVMQQVEKWYNVKVIYNDTPKIKITWYPSRNMDYETFMNYLQKQQSIKIQRRDPVVVISAK